MLASPQFDGPRSVLAFTRGVANAAPCLTGSPHEPSRIALGCWGSDSQAIINSPSDTLIATDFDGTLAPIVEDPAQASADPRAVAALGRLGHYVGTVVVITGRAARTAVELGGFREIAGLGSMIVLGQYGVERWNAVDDEYILPPEPPQVSAAAKELPEILDSLGLAGARIEDKGRAIAVHTRLLPDPEGALVKLEGPLRELAARHGLVLEPGKKVWEIRAPGMDKGVALRSIVDETGARQVIFAGDDLGDLRPSGLYGTLHRQAWRDSSCVQPRPRRTPSPSCPTSSLTALPVLRRGSTRSLSGWVDELKSELSLWSAGPSRVAQAHTWRHSVPKQNLEATWCAEQQASWWVSTCSLPS